jgi:tRNA pseudouridine38-40 synthase
MTRRYKIKLAYDGGAYSGYQYQPHCISVQQKVEEALEFVHHSPIKIFGSSRTDAGVHAKGFMAHFDLTKPIPPKALVRALNARLPEDIRVMAASYAHKDFDARKWAKGKEYRYFIYNAPILPPHLAPYWVSMHKKLDVEAMREAAKRFIGEHDFAPFAANPHRELSTTVRNILDFKITQSGPRIVLIVRGDGFLYKQVRSMAGFLLKVGTGNEKPEAVTEILEARAPRTARVETAPGKGLFLWKVWYK